MPENRITVSKKKKNATYRRKSENTSQHLRKNIKQIDILQNYIKTHKVYTERGLLDYVSNNKQERYTTR